MGVIQRRRAAVSVSTLLNDVKRSVWEKQDGVNVSRLCDQYMVCSQNARRLSARWNLKEKESAVEKKLKKCNQFSLGKLPAGKLFCKFNITRKRREIESRIIEWVVRSLSTLRNAFFIRNFRVNMVAAIDWRSHTTHNWIWFVSFLGFNGPLRHISVYIGPSPKVGERKEKR